MTVSCRSPDNLAANEHGVGWSKLPYARTDFFEPLSERFYTEFLIFGQRLSQTKINLRRTFYNNYGCGSECFMMNDVTLKQIAAVRAIVSKGSHVWI